MKQLFKKHIGKKDSFRRNSLIMSSGAVINILITFILTPIVTRIYDKSEFGVFYIFTSIVTISALVINGMYPYAIVLPKFKKDFLTLLKLCFWMTGIGVVIMFFLTIIIGKPFLKWIDGEKIGNYIYLIPISLLFATLNVIFINWNVRRKEFKKNALSNIVGSISYKGGQIALGTVNPYFSSLIFSKVISDFIKTIVLGAKNMSKDIFLLKNISFSEMKIIAKTYIKYPKFVLPGNFVNSFTSDIPLYLLSAHFGLETVGAFGFAKTMLGIPYNVIGNSIAPVFFQKANELYLNDNEELKKFTITAYNKILVLGGIAFGFIFAFGDIAFEIVFSKEWRLAGQIAGIMSIYYIFRIISSPFSRIFSVFGKQEYGLKISVILAVLRIIGIWVGIQTGDILKTILIYSIANLIGYLINNLMIFKLLKIPILKILLKSILYIVFIYSMFYIFRLGINTLII